MTTAEAVSLAVAKKGTKMIVPVSNRPARGNLERIHTRGASERENPRANFEIFLECPHRPAGYACFRPRCPQSDVSFGLPKCRDYRSRIGWHSGVGCPRAKSNR